MKTYIILVLVVLLILSPLIWSLYRRFKPKKLNMSYFTSKWKELQGFCKDKKTWPDALIEADKLLDCALKKKKFRGKSMGERLVSAQRVFTSNDNLWFAHNLCKKISSQTTVRLKETDVKRALVAFRQALKDVGALPNGEPRDT